MTAELSLGLITSQGKTKGAPFHLPADLIGRKNAVIGVSGCGKTCAVAKIEEELCRIGHTFAVLDTVGVHLGLRAKKDGTPSGLPVVVFGGKRGDLPINEAEVGFGARLAEIVLSSTIPIVIDLSKTSELIRFRIAAEFARTLMNNESPDGRHIIVEETPEFMPETVEFKGQDQCRSEMTRLVTLGRNNGYSVTLVGQRWATIRKTALAMIENFIIMRTTTKADRKRLKEIFEEIASEADVKEIFNSMGKLEDGEAWFFSPQWLKRLERIRFHERDTFHPGETRKIGAKVTQLDMGDVHKFVAQLSKVPTRTAVTAQAHERMADHAAGVIMTEANKDIRVMKRRGQLKGNPRVVEEVPLKEFRKLEEEQRKVALLAEEARNENAALKAEVKSLKNSIKHGAEKLVATREALRPLHEALASLFSDTKVSASVDTETPADASEYSGFFKSAGKYGAKRMLEVMIERKRVHKQQLMGLAGIKKSSFNTARSWMTRNHLMAEEDGYFVLIPVS